MTTPTQQRLSPEAQQRLDQYLHQVRAALSGCPSVNGEEVERDIREHIDSELSAESDEVSVRELSAILERLGSPNQWVPADEMPAWSAFFMRCRTGPEDWRLAYLTLALLTAGILFLQPILMLASYLVARAGLAVARARDESLAAQKWLLYPPLLLGNAFLLVALLLGPAFLAAGGIYVLGEHGSAGHPPGVTVIQDMAAVSIVGTAIWWMVLGIVLARRPKIMQVALAGPIGDRLRAKQAKSLTFAGLGLAALVGAAVGLYFYRVGENSSPSGEQRARFVVSKELPRKGAKNAKKQ
jgi:hypothetical protein